jgi:ATP-binding protein involved in chromosome partitioning
MPENLKDKIILALSRVHGGGRDDIVSAGMVTGLEVSERGDVLFALEVDPAMGTEMENLRLRAEEAALSVPGVRGATVILTAERKPAPPDPHGMNKNPPLALPFRSIIAIGSGKGGVGKSTVAFNLAVALAEKEMKVSLLDADIYGPSVPRLTGLVGKRAELTRTPHLNPPPLKGGRTWDGKPSPFSRGEGLDGGMKAEGKLLPLTAHGIDVMSMGFLVEEEKPMIWRGPMAQSAFYQMLRDVDWTHGEGERDVLVIDMPPGTGDIQLTLAQKVQVSGAVIVSTPQDLALIDARKAIAMFEKTGVKILGLVENMAYYHCPNCGHEDHIFGHGGAKKEAEKLGVPFLGEIPLLPSIRENSDAGKVAGDGSYKEIAEKVWVTVRAF